MKTYLFAGASSEIAMETLKLFTATDVQVIGLTTKSNLSGSYHDVHTISAYSPEALPTLDQPIEGLVYFPGSINLKPFNRITAKEFSDEFIINALNAALVVQKYLPNLKKADRASIVFISSVAVQTGMPFHSSISMAKGAIEGLTRALAAEFAPSIRVNAVAPSLTQTPLAEKLFNTEEKLESASKRHPLKRIGIAKDIANAIRFLLTDESSWITGQILPVDGGMSSIKLM